MNRRLAFAWMALALGGLAWAEPQGDAKPGVGTFLERLKQADKNGDGQISKDEAPAQLWENVLSKRDANGDGAVSKEELMAGGRPGGGGPGGEHPNMADMIMRLDADKDGKVTQAEAGERWERLGRLDKNGDGAVTKDEVPNLGGGPGGGHPNMAEMIMRMDADGDGKVTQAEAGERWERLSKLDKNGDGAVAKDEIPAFGGPGGRPNPEEIFARMDKDGDGKLTSSEVPAEMWERMSKADANGDGSVTKEELAAARQRHAAGGAPEGGKPVPQPPSAS